MVDIEGYSETELEALKALGLIDKDLVEEEAKPVEDNPDTEREAVTKDGTIMPHITVAKNRGNYIDVDIDDMQYFQGMGNTPEEGYIKFIYGECHNPKNEGMIVRGNYKTIAFLNKYDAKIGLFGDHNFEVTDPHQPGKPNPEWKQKIDEQKANGTYKPEPRTQPHMNLTVPMYSQNKRFYHTMSGNWIGDEINSLLDSF